MLVTALVVLVLKREVFYFDSYGFNGGSWLQFCEIRIHTHSKYSGFLLSLYKIRELLEYMGLLDEDVWDC